MAIGLVLAGLAGLHLTVTWLAFRQPQACRFNHSRGSRRAALLAGSACCAPAMVLIGGFRYDPSSFTIIFQTLTPVSVLLLLTTLALILNRTDIALVAAESWPKGHLR